MKEYKSRSLKGASEETVIKYATFLEAWCVEMKGKNPRVFGKIQQQHKVGAHMAKTLMILNYAYRNDRNVLMPRFKCDDPDILKYSRNCIKYFNQYQANEAKKKRAKAKADLIAEAENDNPKTVISTENQSIEEIAEAAGKLKEQFVEIDPDKEIVQPIIVGTEPVEEFVKPVLEPKPSQDVSYDEFVILKDQVLRYQKELYDVKAELSFAQNLLAKTKASIKTISSSSVKQNLPLEEIVESLNDNKLYYLFGFIPIWRIKNRISKNSLKERKPYGRA